MFEGNKKAKELAENAKELIVEANEEFYESSCLLNENLQNYIRLREEITDGVIRDFDETIAKIERIDLDGVGVDMDLARMENVQEKFEESLEEVEDVRIQQPSSGFFGAFIKAIINTAVILAIVIGAGIVANDMEISTQKLPDASQIEALLAWFGKLVYPLGTNFEQIGMIFLGIVAGVTFIASMLVSMKSKADKNLQKAHKLFEKADEVHHIKKEQAAKTNSLSEYTAALAKTLRTLQVYLDEYNARMRRILFVEGDDFSEYDEQSKKDINTATVIVKRIDAILTTNILDENGEITPETRKALEECEMCLKEHLKMKEAKEA